MESWCQALKPAAKRSMDGGLYIYVVKVMAGGSDVMPIDLLFFYKESCE